MNSIVMKVFARQFWIYLFKLKFSNFELEGYLIYEENYDGFYGI